MEIVRDGQKIVLTDEEIRQAWQENEREYMLEGLECRLDEMVEAGDRMDWRLDGLSEEQKKAILEKSLQILEKSWANSEFRNESYWYAKGDAIREAAEELIHEGADTPKKYTIEVTRTQSKDVEVMLRDHELEDLRRRHGSVFADLCSMTENFDYTYISFKIRDRDGNPV